MELSIVLPCLDEARTVGKVVQRGVQALAEQGVQGEVLVADNGSADGSQELARAAGARVVDVPERGYGAALQGGIAAARGRYVLMLDSDDSYDAGVLAPFLERLRAGDDLVQGNRFQGGIAPGAMPFLHRWLGNPGLSAMGRVLFGSPLGDFYCGQRAFRRDSIQRLGLEAKGMEFALEMLCKATLAGLKISEVPVPLRPDGRGRPPHLRTWRDGLRSVHLYARLAPARLPAAPALGEGAARAAVALASAALAVLLGAAAVKAAFDEAPRPAAVDGGTRAP